MYYEGEFANNKPNGQGKWIFKNGNVLEGEYEQKKKEEGEDEAPADEEEEGGEGGAPKPKFNLLWHSNTYIA